MSTVCHLLISLNLEFLIAIPKTSFRNSHLAKSLSGTPESGNFYFQGLCRATYFYRSKAIGKYSKRYNWVSRVILPDYWLSESLFDILPIRSGLHCNTLHNKADRSYDGLNNYLKTDEHKKMLWCYQINWNTRPLWYLLQWLLIICEQNMIAICPFFC